MNIIIISSICIAGLYILSIAGSAISKKLKHVHDFKLVETNSVYKDGYKLPIKIIKYFMCECGETKRIEVSK